MGCYWKIYFSRLMGKILIDFVQLLRTITTRRSPINRELLTLFCISYFLLSSCVLVWVSIYTICTITHCLIKNPLIWRFFINETICRRDNIKNSRRKYDDQPKSDLTIFYGQNFLRSFKPYIHICQGLLR